MAAEPLHADTTALHALGDAFDAHAAALDALAATLRATPSPASALGPVGDRFVAAFTEAVARHAAEVTALGVRAGRTAAHRNAERYDTAGAQAAELLPEV